MKTSATATTTANVTRSRSLNDENLITPSYVWKRRNPTTKQSRKSPRVQTSGMNTSEVCSAP